MSFDDRVAAVEIATQFQESSKEVFKMVGEETELAKTQVILQLKWYLIIFFNYFLFLFLFFENKDAT